MAQCVYVFLMKNTVSNRNRKEISSSELSKGIVWQEILLLNWEEELKHSLHNDQNADWARKRHAVCMCVEKRSRKKNKKNVNSYKMNISVWCKWQRRNIVMGLVLNWVLSLLRATLIRINAASTWRNKGHHPS